MLEYWNVGILGIKAENNPFHLNCKRTPSNPLFHYSIIPSFHYSNWGEAPKFFLLPPEIVIVHRIKA
jgi:hypothetical protein